MTKIMKDILIIVKDLKKCNCYKTISRTLNVAEHKNFGYDDFIKETTLQFIKK